MSSVHRKKKRRINLLSITATISTSLVLLLIGIITFMLLSAGRLSHNLREEMTLELVLKDGLDIQNINDLRNILSSMPYSKECEYISKEDALAEMSAEMGVDPSEFLQYNPFYASISLRLSAEYANYDSLATFLPTLRELPQVKDVNYQRELLDSVNSNIRKASLILLVLAVLLTLISVTLINNTIKLTIYSLRFILYSMKLVGARWSFIRRPFIRKNLKIGIISAIIACVGIWGGLHFCSKYEPGLATLVDSSMLIPVFAVIFLTGILITWLCALTSVNRFLKMKSGELYYI